MSSAQLDIHVRAPIQRLDWYYMLVDFQSKNWMTKINLRPPTTTTTLIHSGPANLSAGLNLPIQCDSLFLITNEGVFFQSELGWVELEVIGVSFEGFASPACTCCLFVLWSMSVCLKEEIKKFDCLPLYVITPLLCLHQKTPSADSKGTLCSEIHRIYKWLNPH